MPGLFEKEKLEDPDRLGPLVGKPVVPKADTGPLICSCFGVGRNAIMRAIQKRELATPEAIGQGLKAGTSCGSCVPALQKLLQHHSAALAASRSLPFFVGSVLCRTDCPQLHV